MPRTRTPDLDAAEPATLIARGEARPAAEPAGATWSSSTPDVDAFVIDPESECLVLAETVGGTAIRPDAPGVRINLLDLSGRRRGHPASMGRDGSRSSFASTTTAPDDNRQYQFLTRTASMRFREDCKAFHLLAVSRTGRRWDRQALLCPRQVRRG